MLDLLRSGSTPGFVSSSEVSFPSESLDGFPAFPSTDLNISAAAMGVSSSFGFSLLPDCISEHSVSNPSVDASSMKEGDKSDSEVGVSGYGFGPGIISPC